MNMNRGRAVPAELQSWAGVLRSFRIVMLCPWVLVKQDCLHRLLQMSMSCPVWAFVACGTKEARLLTP